MIFDCFCFNDEYDLLNIRLHTLDPVVDRFVLCESRITQAGTPKPLFYDMIKNTEPFVYFKNKIRHIIVDDPASDNPMSNDRLLSPRWINEGHQRNCLARGLTDITQDDLIFISDVDEIINPEVVDQLSPLKGPFHLIMNFYYYYMDCRLNHADNISFCCRKNHLDAHNNITEMVFNRKFMFRPRIHGGWHYSYLMSPERISEKIKQMADSHYSKPEFWNIEHIEECMRTPKDLFGRQGEAFKMRFLKNNDMPSYVLNNLDKFGKYFYL